MQIEQVHFSLIPTLAIQLTILNLTIQSLSIHEVFHHVTLPHEQYRIVLFEENVSFPTKSQKLPANQINQIKNKNKKKKNQKSINVQK